MNKTVRPVIAGSAHIAAAWLFFVAALLAGIVGVYRLMSPGATGTIVGADSAGCMCLAVLLGILAAVLALLGVHKQLGVMAMSIGPTYQGSHGSGDDT